MIIIALDNFIPEIWSGQLLVNLKNDLVYASPQVANRNYEGEVSAFGDTVRINSIGAVSVGDYVKNVNHNAPETLNDNQQVLVIDQAKMFNFQIDDVDAAQQNPKLMGAAMREASFALANVVDQFMSNLLNAGVSASNTLNGGSAITVTNDNSATGWPSVYENFVDLGVKLDQTNTPAAGRYAVVTPKVLGYLRKDARFSSFGTEANRSLIANGAVGRIADFDILVSNQPPTGADASQPVILAGHNWATTYADQIAEVRAYRPELRFADAVKGLHVYGAKVIRPELLAKMTLDFPGTTL